MIKRPRLSSLLGFVAALLSCVVCVAQSHAQPASHMRWNARAIDVLDEAEIKVVGEFARDRVRVEDKRLTKILQRLAYVQGYRAATLMWLLTPSAGAYDRRKDLRDLLSKIRPGLLRAKVPWSLGVAMPGMGPLGHATTLGADASQAVKQPYEPMMPGCRRLAEEAAKGAFALQAALWDSKNSLDCLGQKLDLKGFQLLMVSGRPSDKVRVLTGGKVPRFFALDGDDGYFTKDAFIFVTPVPEGVPITVTLLHEGESALPLVWSATTDHDVIRDASSTITGCLDVDLKSRRNAHRLFFDGAPIDIDRDVTDLLFVDTPSVKSTAGEPELPQGAESHEIVVIDDDANVVVARRSIPASEIYARNCYRREINLEQARQANDVSIAEVKAGGLCVAAGIDSPGLAVQTDEVLRALRKRPKHFEGWDAMRDGDEMKRLLVTAPDASQSRDHRAPDAPPDKRPPGDADYQVKADSALNTGFGKLVSVELHCYKQNDADIEYTVVARSLTLGQRERRLSDVRRQQIRRAKGRADIRGALRAALGQLLEVSYTRFVRAPAGSFRGRLEYDVEAYVSPLRASDRAAQNQASDKGAKDQASDKAAQAPVTLELFGAELEEQEIPSLCRPLEAGDTDFHAARERKDELTTTMVHTRFRKYDSRELTGSGPTTTSLYARPTRPGTYVFRACLRQNGSCSQVVTDRCVEVGEPRTRIWVELGYAGPVGKPRNDARVEHIHILESTLGVSWQLAATLPWWLGFRFGYEREMHTSGALTSWQDLLLGKPTPPPGSLAWVRHSVVFGPTFEVRGGACGILRIDKCRRGGRYVEAFLRLSPALIDIGFIDASSIPSSLTEFAQGARGIDVDLSSKFQIGLSFTPSSQFGTYIAGGLALRGLNDWYWTEAKARAQTHRIDTTAQTAFTLVAGGEFAP